MLFRLLRFKERCAVHPLVILVALGTSCARQRSFKLKRHTEEQAEFGE